MTTVFISYRRDDNADAAGRIFDRLVGQFGKDSVFMDVDSMPLGKDFRAVLFATINKCDVFLAIIGDNWTDCLIEQGPDAGLRRLDDPGDYVRQEIEEALRRDILVLPVLVGNARMPREEDLPDSLKMLCFRHATEVRAGTDYASHINRLITAVEQHTQPQLKDRPTQCPRCQQTFRVPRELLGKRICCPHCHTNFMSYINYQGPASDPTAQAVSAVLTATPALPPPVVPVKPAVGKPVKPKAKPRLKVVPQQVSRRRRKSVFARLFTFLIVLLLTVGPLAVTAWFMYQTFFKPKPNIVLEHGHSSFINALVFSPDDQTILTGSADYTAILWDALDGSKLRTFKGHTKEISSVAISPNGQWALLGSWDRTATLWDLASGKKRHTLYGHSGAIGAVAFSPDGQWAVTGAWDRLLILWHADSGKKVRTLRGHRSGIETLAFAPDSIHVLTGSADGTAILWNVILGQQVRTFRGHSGQIHSVAFRPDGQQVATASKDKTVILWEAATAKRLHTFHGHSDAVRCVAFAPTGKQLLTGSADKTAILWDISTGKQVRVFKEHTRPIHAVAFNSDGSWLATGSADSTAILRNTKKGLTLPTLSTK